MTHLPMYTIIIVCSTSDEKLVVECNEGCVLTQGKYLTCPISSIWKLKEAEPSNITKAESEF